MLNIYPAIKGGTGEIENCGTSIYCSLTNISCTHYAFMSLEIISQCCEENINGLLQEEEEKNTFVFKILLTHIFSSLVPKNKKGWNREKRNGRFNSECLFVSFN